MTDDTVRFGPEDPKPPVPAELAPPTPREELDAHRKSPTTNRAAAAMRIAGASDVEIAELLGYVSPGAARAAWEGAIAGTFNPDTDYRSLRRLSSARYEAVLKSLAPMALHREVMKVNPKDPTGPKVKMYNEEHLAYAKLFVLTVDKINVLHGLNAPQVIQLQTPNSEEFERVVGALTSLARGDESQEGDIFEEGPDGIFESTEDKDEDDGDI